MVRGLALLGFLGALLVLVTDWAVRHQHLQPFGWWPRAIRKMSDPLISPLERRLRHAGANPADAPLWLLGAVLVGGLLAQSLVGWIGNGAALVTTMRGAGSGAWVRLVVGGVTSLIMTAIIVRVIGSWLGAGRNAKWMRPVFLLTDWIMQPIARRLPNIGMIDLSPFVAYLLLMLIRALLASSAP